MAAPAPPFVPGRGGLAVAVRLTPRAGRAGVGGLAIDADGRARIRVRVTAPPEKGKANAAMLKLLAREWGLPRGRLAIAAGGKDRNKTVVIEGDAEALARQLEGWLDDHAE